MGATPCHPGSLLAACAGDSWGRAHPQQRIRVCLQQGGGLVQHTAHGRVTVSDSCINNAVTKESK